MVRLFSFHQIMKTNLVCHSVCNYLWFDEEQTSSKGRRGILTLSLPNYRFSWCIIPQTDHFAASAMGGALRFETQAVLAAHQWCYIYIYLKNT